MVLRAVVPGNLQPDDHLLDQVLVLPGRVRVAHQPGRSSGLAGNHRFLACGLATPQVPEEGPIDLDAFHARHGRRYTAALGVFMLVAILQGFAMGDFGLADAYLSVDATVPAALSLTAFFAAFFIGQRWLQLLVPLVFLGSSAAYYGQLIGW
jgi:hypothetical protein